MKRIISKFISAIGGKKQFSDRGSIHVAAPALATRLAPGSADGTNEPPYSEPQKHTVQHTPGSAPIIKWC